MNTNTTFSTQSNIVEDWYGGYKLELDLTSHSKIDNWTLTFDLPYNISAAYGVDLTNNYDGSYTIQGKDGWENLNQGQSIKTIFIIEDYNQQALPLEITTSNDTSSIESSYDNFSADNSNDTVGNISEDVITDDVITDDVITDDVITDDVITNDVITTSGDGGKVIRVEEDFGGDLAAAIASANDGETVELGDKTYYTSGIKISQDITISGQENSVINGGGTSDSIINLAPGASGATIQNVAITNGNNGIYSYGASNLTLQNIDVYNIGQSETIADGENNTGMILNYADGLQIIDSNVYDVGRKGVSVGDTNGAVITGLNVESVNLQAKHSQSHDAAGIKFYNTNDIVLKDSYFANINANNIWNDTTNKTTMENNVIEDVGSAFLKPSFDDNIDISGIYNEKSSNSSVKYNYASSVEDFASYNATEFTTETMIMEENNFSIVEINTQDYWVNESAEKLIAITEDPSEADFSLFAEEYAEYVIID